MSSMISAMVDDMPSDVLDHREERLATLIGVAGVGAGITNADQVFPSGIEPLKLRCEILARRRNLLVVGAPAVPTVLGHQDVAQDLASPRRIWQLIHDLNPLQIGPKVVIKKLKEGLAHAD